MSNRKITNSDGLSCRKETSCSRMFSRQFCWKIIPWCTRSSSWISSVRKSKNLSPAASWVLQSKTEKKRRALCPLSHFRKGIYFGASCMRSLSVEWLDTRVLHLRGRRVLDTGRLHPWEGWFDTASLRERVHTGGRAGGGGFRFSSGDGVLDVGLSFIILAGMIIGSGGLTMCWHHCIHPQCRTALRHWFLFVHTGGYHLIWTCLILNPTLFKVPYQLISYLCDGYLLA